MCGYGLCAASATPSVVQRYLTAIPFTPGHIKNDTPPWIPTATHSHDMLSQSGNNPDSHGYYTYLSSVADYL